MDNVVESIFGLSPAQIQQRQNVGMMTAANNYASQDPLQRAAASMFAGGGMLAGAGAQAAGMMTPEMQQAQRTQAIMASGGDLQTSAGLKAKAKQFADAGDPQTAMRLLMLAQDREAKEAKSDPFGQIAPKDYTPESIAVYMRTKSPADLRIPTTVAPKDKQTNDIQEYEYAKKNGYTGSFAQWMTRNAKMKSGSVDGDSPPQSMLQKDQRWVKKDGQWVAEIIPGTKTDQKLKGDFATDQDAYNTLVDTTKTGKAKIAAILSPENEKGFKGMFGGYNAKYGTQYMSGNTAAVKQKLETLKSELKAAGLAIMRSGGGVGQITEKEWAIMEKLIDSVDPLMDEKDARNVLKSISEQLDTALIKGKRKFETEWADSRYAGGRKGGGASGSWSDL